MAKGKKSKGKGKPLGFDKQKYYEEVKKGAKQGSPSLQRELARIENENRIYEELLKQTQIEKERQNIEIIKRKEERAALTKAEKKRIAAQEQAEFNRHIGNYQARDYTSNITSWTASQVVRKPFNRSGLRSEFQSRGYTDRTSGMPAADYKNMTVSLVKGQVRGTLDLGSTKVKKGLTPSIVPNLDFILGNPANTGIGSGNVIMPVGMLKIKKRGGKFNVYP